MDELENFREELHIYIRDDNEFFSSGEMVHIIELEEKFRRLKNKGATHIRFYAPDDYDIDFTAYQVRKETDDEMIDRINKENEKRALEIDKERQLYLKLKKKFEE